MNPVLFLDFDGVLHPEPSFSHETFSQLPLVEAVLRAFLSVDIVISSTWRMNTPEERILSYFSKDIVPRVIGFTPYMRSSSDDSWLPYHREGQCLSWLTSNRPAGTPWMALDDRDDWFSPGCPNLMKIDGGTGFMASDEELFRQHLTRITTA